MMSDSYLKTTSKGTSTTMAAGRGHPWPQGCVVLFVNGKQQTKKERRAKCGAAQIQQFVEYSKTVVAIFSKVNHTFSLWCIKLGSERVTP